MKKFALFCAAAAAAMGMNAQETALTAEMWHQWTGWGADATVIEDADPGVEYNIGKEVGQGDMVIGNNNCNGDIYADLSDYAGIEGEATPGITVRLFLNRDGLQGPGLDIKVDTDAEGKFSYLFSGLGDVEFVHLNFVKIAAVWQGGKWPEGLEKAEVKTFNLIEKEAPAALTVGLWHKWTGWGADATVIEDAETGVESYIGKEIGQGDMVIGNPNCNGDLYADLSEFGGIAGVATPGITMRLYFNRDGLQGPGLDIKVDTDAEGKFSYLFSELGNVEFVHLNFVKTAAVWQSGKWPEGLEKAVVESMYLLPKGSSEEPVEPDPVDPLAITGSWFHEWDNFGADATVVNMTPGVDDQIGKEVGVGATILGPAAVPGSVYADLTQYSGIEAEGTPGVAIRLLFNRPSMEGGSEPITECNPVFDENGKFTFLFTEVAAKEGADAYPYVHLNAVKMPWGLPEGISSCTITKFNAIPLDPSAVKTIGNAEENAVIYNIYGQRVDENYRGIVIKNGKKYINR